jgi:hypothetical protein
MPANDGIDPVKLLFESWLQRQRNSNRTNETTNERIYNKQKANLRMRSAYRSVRFGRLNASIDPVSPTEGR